MKFAFHSGTFGSLSSWVNSYQLDESMRRIARAGYTDFELLCAAPHAWPDFLTDEDVQQINNWQKEYGVNIHSVEPVRDGAPGHNLATSCKEERDWSRKHLKQVIDLAHSLGAGTLSYCAGWVSPGSNAKEARKYALESLVEIGEYAKGKGVVICINPTITLSDVVDTASDALYLMEDSGLSNVKVMFDMELCFNYRLDPGDVVRQCGEHLGHIQICDRDRQAPGSGYDFYPVLQALKDIGYDGYITIEIGNSRKMNPSSVARKSLLHLREVEKTLL